MAGLLANCAALNSAHTLSFNSLRTRRTPVQATYVNPAAGRTPVAAVPTLTQFSARIDQLHSSALKAVETAASSAFNAAPSSPLLDASSPSLSVFRDKINDWWADHLVSKASFVEATAPSAPSDDEEDIVILKPPVEVNAKFQLPVTGPHVNF